jgi:hypothetical protein
MIVLLLLLIVVRLVVSACGCNRLGARVLRGDVLLRLGRRLLILLRTTTTTFGCNNGTRNRAAL